MSEENIPWWKRRVEYGPPLCSNEVGRAIQNNLVLQSVLIVLIGGQALDGGMLVRIFSVAAVGYWIAAAPILLRRRFSPSKGELSFLRIGYIVFIPISIISMPLWGCLREFLK